MKASNSATTHTAIDGLKAEAFEKLMEMEDNSERSNKQVNEISTFLDGEGQLLGACFRRRTLKLGTRLKPKLMSLIKIRIVRIENQW